MKGFREKYKYILAPYLLSFLAVMGGYTALRWILDSWLGLLNVKEIVLDLFLPAGIMSAVMIFYILPRLKILHIEQKNISLYFFAFGYAAIIPLCISQAYVSTSFYSTIEINEPNEIALHSKEKYFFIENLPVVNSVDAYHIDLRKTQNGTSVHEFFAFPVNQNLGVWYGDRNVFSISNALSKDEKEKKYQEFISNVQSRLGTYKIKKSGHFELLKSSILREGLAQGIHKSQPSSVKHDLFILTPLSESFRDEQNGLITWFFSTFILGFLSLLFFLRKPEVSFIGLKDLKEGNVELSPTKQFIVESVRVNGKYPLTAILININILFFIISMFLGVLPIWPTVNELVQVGAVNGKLVDQGEYWRLLSSNFLHAGIGHLLANMFTLAYFGRVLEPALSRLLICLLFIISGLVGTIFSVILTPESTVVGALGAIFGVIGACILLSRSEVFSKEKRKEIFWLAIIVIAAATVIGLVVGNVAHAAHFGGLATGVTISYLLGDKMSRKRKCE